MAQKQIQEQKLTQQQKLAQSITQQQLLQAQLTELPITQLLERIKTEMDDNPALEVSADESQDFPEYQDSPDNQESTSSDDYEQEERQSAMDAALESIGRDDEDLPVYQGGHSGQEDREEIVYGQTESFIDQLNEQMNMANITERQRDIMEYLIGSLDDDGLLRKSLDNISDELAIYHHLDASTKEIEEVLLLLQDFDPAGIGARTLQECLLLQIQRREPSRLKELMELTISEYFDLFTKKHWQRLQQILKLSELQAATLIAELRKLNPKPGSSISETVGRSLQQITPDFIVETHDDGTITFESTAEGCSDPNIAAQLADQTMEYTVMGNNYRMDMSVGIDVSIISNGNTKTVTTLFAIPGYGKYYRQLTEEDFQKAQSTTKYDYKYTDEAKTIAGYSCKKVVVTATDLETDEEMTSILWVTNELGLGDDINFAQNPGLKGYPLSTEVKSEINGEEVTIVTTATKVTPNKKVKPTNFLLPSDAKDFSEAPDELKAMLGGADEEE